MSSDRDGTAADWANSIASDARIKADDAKRRLDTLEQRVAWLEQNMNNLLHRLAVLENREKSVK